MGQSHARTVLRRRLERFVEQTDFAKRLVCFRANEKFEDPPDAAAAWGGGAGGAGAAGAGGAAGAAGAAGGAAPRSLNGS